MLWLGRRETQHLLSIHHCLAESVGNLHHSVLRLLVSDRIEMHGAGNARYGRQPVALLVASADFLNDNSHLFFRHNARSSGDIAARSGKIHAGIDALDSLGEQSELLVLIFGMRNHIGRIHPRKRLIIRVFQL